ncbi:hypothetical protein CANCADRAFT_28813 [Tortispora caseinolytica NRRL Y-17796]|uniref:Ubiquinol-cytochrome c chaperone domain-containing protein n=1 Tax=Tortispora caseinolytica NRRL Y-17796 TaxID=767744 RepID=A0A1E4TCB6_9ASCO|nr:hypothetical protein CANCADRAFT_28813 [Tortispora caseinolytica NRRL Y-17796]
MTEIKAAPTGVKYYELCAAQGEFLRSEKLSETAQFYYKSMGLPMTFQQWMQISALHIWMIYVRMRALNPDLAKLYQQALVDIFNDDIEQRIYSDLKIKSSSRITRYQKDFALQLRGGMLAYDEGLIFGDAVMAQSLWRNLFLGKPDVEVRHLAVMTRYVRTQLYLLDQMTDDQLIRGKATFIRPWVEYRPVNK